MRKRPIPVSDKLIYIVSLFGENLRAARERRKITIEDMAERVGVSVSTILRIEKGNCQLPISTYIQAMYILGLEHELINLCKEDSIGRQNEESGEKFAKRRLRGYKSRKIEEEKEKKKLVKLERKNKKAAD